MDIVRDYFDVYAEGLGRTVALTLTAFALAMVIGLVIAAARVSPIAPARAAGALYVETIRNTPLLVLMLLLVFGLPKVGFGVTFYAGAVLALSLYTGAFLAEAVRSGINAVARGQAEAARSIGLTFPQTLLLVILPQALRTVVQPIGSLFIALTKNTSIAYAGAAVVELVGAADRVSTDTADPITALSIAAVVYLSLTLPTGVLLGFVERRVAIKR